MSARDLQTWLARVAPMLAAAGITAQLARGPKIGSQASTWISFSSRLGAGRLVRASDGSSVSTAHRYADGVQLVNAHAPITTEEQLDILTRALRPVSILTT